MIHNRLVPQMPAVMLEKVHIKTYILSIQCIYDVTLLCNGHGQDEVCESI